LLFPSRCLEAALGKTAEARDLLSPVYNSFTEGFDTKNLQEAKVLLDELT
jgi:predicted ATPase